MSEPMLKAEVLPQAQSVPAAHVAVIISTHIIGGPGKGLLQLIPELNRAGYAQATLCVFRKVKEQETPFLYACRKRGIEVVSLWQRFNYDPRPIWQLWRLIREQNIGIIQTHGYKENLFGLCVSLLTGRRWICFLHGTTNENIKIHLYQALDRCVIRFADRILAVSNELLNRLVPARHRQKARLIENAIDARIEKAHPFVVEKWKRRHGVRKDNVIVCIGRLSPEKGQAGLLKAARGLKAMGLDFQLLLVGDGPERRRLERFCRQWELTQHVKFMGQRNDLAVIYQAASLLVLPSFKEGMPNVILEAMAYALPIVATRVGAVPEMLRADVDAALVPPADPAALQAALADLLRDPERARRYGEAGCRALFPRFSVTRRATAMEGVYRDLMQET